MSTNPIKKIDVELQINAKYITPMKTSSRDYLRDHAVLIDQGRIIELVPIQEAQQKYQAAKVISLKNHVLLPGLINSYCSIGASLFHSIGHDLPHSLRLQNHLIPLEQQWLGDELIELASELSIAQMLKTGTSAFSSHYFAPHISAKTAVKHGIKASIGIFINPASSCPALSSESELAHGLQLRDDYKHQSLVDFNFSLPDLNTISDDLLTKIATISNELGIKLNIQAHRSLAEIEQSVRRFTKRPIKRLEQFSLLSPDLNLSQVNHLQRNEIEILAKAKTYNLVCPQASIKTVNSIAPISSLLMAKANLVLASHNLDSSNLNLLKEISLAALLGKIEGRSSNATTAYQMLQAVTINAAEALAISDTSGSVSPNKDADLCAIELDDLQDISAIHCDPNEQIVYNAQQSQVSHLWLKGKAKVTDYQLTDIDEAYLVKNVSQWQKKLSH